MPYNKQAMSDLKKGFEADTASYDPIAKGLANAGSAIKGLFASNDDAMGEAITRRKEKLNGMKKQYE